MERHPALQVLSREHHAALALGRALSAPDAGFHAGLPADGVARVQAVLARYGSELQPHFWVEERELLPLAACGGAELREAAATLHAQHGALRARFGQLSPDNLTTVGVQLGEQLVAHVRFEERVLFPALQAALDETALGVLSRRLSLTPRSLITGFHQDEVGDWVADLDCGHSQHMRHRPPFQSAPWVQSATGRYEKLGELLACPLCRMPRLPVCARPYRSTPVYTAATVPAGLLRRHDLKAGTWGRIDVQAGRVAYVLEDEDDLTVVLRPGVAGIVAPQRPHHIEPQPDAVLQVHFLRCGPADGYSEGAGGT